MSKTEELNKKEFNNVVKVTNLITKLKLGKNELKAVIKFAKTSEECILSDKPPRQIGVLDEKQIINLQKELSYTDQLKQLTQEQAKEISEQKKERDDMEKESCDLKETLQQKREIISILKGLLEVALGKDK